MQKNHTTNPRQGRSLLPPRPPLPPLPRTTTTRPNNGPVDERTRLLVPPPPTKRITRTTGASHPSYDSAANGTATATTIRNGTGTSTTASSTAPIRSSHNTWCSISCGSAVGAIVLTLFIFMGIYAMEASNDYDYDDNSGNNIVDTLWRTLLFRPPPQGRRRYYPFAYDDTDTTNFTFGVATSAYQIEGAAHQEGRGPSVWDVFCHARPGATVGNQDATTACDHYHRVQQDVALMASLNVRAYRFSLAWPRILPTGRRDHTINPAGIAFYHFLIDTLLRYNIEPWVTLFHWDLPQALEEDLGGWLSINTSYAFAEYASLCFEEFGHKVSRWITINEAWTVAINGYATGIHAPGHVSTTEPYLAAHNLLLAHGLAVQAFREYQTKTNTTTTTGMIGIANCGDYRYPTTVADNATAQRVMEFQFGWLTDPLFWGEYPIAMRQRLGDRLPTFTPDQRKLLIGSVDFVGLNYYSALQASTPTVPPTAPGYWTTDIDAVLHPHPEWRLNDMGWPVVPEGLRNMLLWISQRYNYPLLYITENGDAEHSDDTRLHPLADVNRQDYLLRHIRAAGQAMEDYGVRLGGYFAWTFMDNFEWQFSYTKKFGLVQVNFADGSLRRTPKQSAYWYNHTIAVQGRNIRRAPSLSWFPSV